MTNRPAYRQVAWLAPFAVPANRNRGRLPHLPHEVRAIRQYSPASHDGNGILPYWIFRRRPELPQMVRLGSGQSGSLSTEDLPGGIPEPLAPPPAHAGRTQCIVD